MRKLFAALCVAGIMLAGAGPALAHRPSQNAQAERLCEKEGGLFVDLGGLVYACVLPTAASDKDIRRDERLCDRQGGLFLAVGNVAYACVLPGGVFPVDGIPTDGGLLEIFDGGLRLTPIIIS